MQTESLTAISSIIFFARMVKLRPPEIGETFSIVPISSMIPVNIRQS
jgi:hypothetical protein